jgi:hypothetical protein
MASAAVVRAVNALAGRWAHAVLPVDAATRDTVFSPAGAWPLLAALAAGADGQARVELEEAVGLWAAEAMAGARDLMAALQRMPGVSAALGLWTREALELEPGWALGLPEGTLGRLTGDPSVDKPRLDAWAKEATDGRIERMPMAVDKETLLALASGLLARTRWLNPFLETGHWPEQGPWAGRDLPALLRSSTLLDRAAVIDAPTGPVTEHACSAPPGSTCTCFSATSRPRPAPYWPRGSTCSPARGCARARTACRPARPVLA